MSYQSLLKTRCDLIDGIGDWMWVAEDHGAWTGPAKEWIETHRDAYLNSSKGREIIIQAGGNCGLYPRLFAKYFKWVYTFEPDPLNFHCLVNNCQMDNIIKINGALGANNEMVKVQRHSMNNVGMHKIDQKGGQSFIPQFTVDQLKLPACSFIQLDVEGYEINILKGAIETIKKYKPGIACENGLNNSITEFMAEMGYNPIITVGADTIYAAE